MTERRYWDSSVIIAILNDERGRASICQAILDAAERGEIKIFISALVMAEVLKYEGAKPIGKEKRQKVTDFFKYDYFVVVNVDRWIEGDAQEIYWDHNIYPKDAIHLATAIQLGVDVFETFDKDLLKKDGNIGSPALRIREPAQIQLGLFDINKSDPNPHQKSREIPTEVAHGALRHPESMKISTG